MRSKKIFTFFLLATMFLNIFFSTVSAQATTTLTASIYGTDTIQKAADELCSQYTNFKTVYEPASAGGGGSVPVDLTQLRPVLEAINKNTQLTANEERAANTLKYCIEYQNMAKASNRLAQDTAKQLKTLNDSCYTDERCLLKRVKDESIQIEIKLAQSYPLFGREISQIILNLDQPKKNKEIDYDKDLVQACNEAYRKGRNPDECIMVPYAEDIIKEAVYTAKNRIEQGQSDIKGEFFRGNGVFASRPCTKTASGRDPSEIKFYEADCISYRQDPTLINQENLRQIVSLPYTQAYSPSSVLGADQVINNINTRIRQGNLNDPDISSNFGSIQAGGANPITGGGGGSTGTGDLASVDANFKKLISNIDVITNLYEVGRLAYASTTSVCRVLPVATRNSTIQKVDAAKKTYTDYKADMIAKYTAAQKTPKESHTALIIQINFDLKDKVNQQLIDKVYDSVKALLQTCVTAAGGATT